MDFQVSTKIEIQDFNCKYISQHSADVHKAMMVVFNSH